MSALGVLKFKMILVGRTYVETERYRETQRDCDVSDVMIVVESIEALCRRGDIRRASIGLMQFGDVQKLMKVRR